MSFENFKMLLCGLFMLTVSSCSSSSKSNSDSDILNDTESDSFVSTDSGVNDSSTVETDSETDSLAEDSDSVDSDSVDSDTSDTDVENGEEFFDDFSYTDRAEAASEGGWLLRTWGGGPGPAGCSWSADNINFSDDSDDALNRVMILTASTDGTGSGSVQAEISTSTRFLAGTYAARVRFTDVPESGTPDGDEIVETFYTITPYSMAGQEEYSEIDFEYLANGGWGTSEPTMFETTWEKAEPADNTHSQQSKSLEGWHILLFTVFNGEVNYYVDGKLAATHGGIFYPESLMSINFNLWFIEDGFELSNSDRTYRQDVDWVYHAKDKLMSNDAVIKRIESFRTGKITSLDTIL
ncbi:MAG: glycoside hydrolase family 16 protein [Deltaproteobacteria bacterium]|nr:glycoside hydrolase family 16 protein [Deltaproteobacteria bacterium]